MQFLRNKKARNTLPVWRYHFHSHFLPLYVVLRSTYFWNALYLKRIDNSLNIQLTMSIFFIMFFVSRISFGTPCIKHAQTGLIFIFDTSLYNTEENMLWIYVFLLFDSVLHPSRSADWDIGDVALSIIVSTNFPAI